MRRLNELTYSHLRRLNQFTYSYSRRPLSPCPLRSQSSGCGCAGSRRSTHNLPFDIPHTPCTPHLVATSHTLRSPSSGLPYPTRPTRPPRLNSRSPSPGCGCAGSRRSTPRSLVHSPIYLYPRAWPRSAQVAIIWLRLRRLAALHAKISPLAHADGVVPTDEAMAAIDVWTVVMQVQHGWTHYSMNSL